MQRLSRLCWLGVLCVATASRALASEATDDMADAAKEFLGQLTADQVEKAKLDFRADERQNWTYVPKDRKGIPLKNLNKLQMSAFHALLDTGLSERGFVKATSIIDLEKTLKVVEDADKSLTSRPVRDPGLYYLSVFGTPDKNKTWGWRIEGHHLAFNFTLIDGKTVSATPVFMGANPAEVKDGPKRGLRTLPAEEDLARQLVEALDEDQRAKAVATPEGIAPKEILTGTKRHLEASEPPKFPTDGSIPTEKLDTIGKIEGLDSTGVALQDMNRAQAELLIKLVKEYVYRLRDEFADEEWKKIRQAGLEKIHFAYAGSFEPGKGQYYRVQGPTFVIEYNKTQNQANHIHSVWRSLGNDFGIEDLKAADPNAVQPFVPDQPGKK